MNNIMYKKPSHSTECDGKYINKRKIIINNNIIRQTFSFDCEVHHGTSHIRLEDWLD